jgi:transposase
MPFHLTYGAHNTVSTDVFTSPRFAASRPGHDLSDEQWERIVPLLPELKYHEPRRGRPCVDLRRVVNSVLWVLHTGRPWNAMPDRYAPYQTAHRYYLRWLKSGVLARVAIELFDTDAVLGRFATRKREPADRLVLQRPVCVVERPTHEALEPVTDDEAHQTTQTIQAISPPAAE